MRIAISIAPLIYSRVVLVHDRFTWTSELAIEAVLPRLKVTPCSLFQSFIFVMHLNYDRRSKYVHGRKLYRQQITTNHPKSKKKTHQGLNNGMVEFHIILAAAGRNTRSRPTYPADNTLVFVCFLHNCRWVRRKGILCYGWPNPIGRRYLPNNRWIYKMRWQVSSRVVPLRGRRRYRLARDVYSAEALSNACYGVDGRRTPHPGSRSSLANGLLLLQWRMLQVEERYSRAQLRNLLRILPGAILGLQVQILHWSPR